MILPSTTSKPTPPSGILASNSSIQLLKVKPEQTYQDYYIRSFLHIPLEFYVISNKRNRSAENGHPISLHTTILRYIINGINILPSGQVIDTEGNRTMRQQSQMMARLSIESKIKTDNQGTR